MRHAPDSCPARCGTGSHGTGVTEQPTMSKQNELHGIYNIGEIGLCRTTTFSGQAVSVTLVANRAVNQMARWDAARHRQSNHRAGGLPLIWGVLSRLENCIFGCAERRLILTGCTWCTPTSPLGWHAAVALMTGCEAHPTMYRTGSPLVRAEATPGAPPGQGLGRDDMARGIEASFTRRQPKQTHGG